MPGFCVSCGTPLTGPFCNQCGARAVPSSAPVQTALSPVTPATQPDGFQTVNVPGTPVQPVTRPPGQDFQPVQVPATAAPTAQTQGTREHPYVFTPEAATKIPKAERKKNEYYQIGDELYTWTGTGWRPVK